jgi:hypothetical protein
MVVLVGACVLSVAVITGQLWAGAEHGGRAAAVRPADGQAARVDWSVVLTGLDRSRSLAFAEADPARLDGVYAKSSPALTRDRALLARLRAAGQRATGVELVPTSLKVVGRSDRRVVLRVVDVMAAYELVRADDGATASTRPGRGPATWTVTLVREGSAWRMYDVQRG